MSDVAGAWSEATAAWGMLIAPCIGLRLREVNSRAAGAGGPASL